MLMIIYEILKNGIFSGTMIGLMAIAFLMVYRVTKVFHIAIGAVFLVGGYASYVASNYFGFQLYGQIIFSVVLCIAFGLMIEVMLYRRFYQNKSSGSVRLIGSLSVLIIVGSLMILLFGAQLNIIPNSDDRIIDVLFFRLTEGDLRHMFFSLIIVTFLFFIFKRSQFGLNIRAISSNSDLLDVLGVDTLKIKLFVVALSSGIVGIVASLITYREGIDPSSAWPVTLSSAVAMIIGMKTYLEGPFMAGVMIGCIKSASVYFISNEWSNFIIYMLFLIALLFKKDVLVGNE